MQTLWIFGHSVCTNIGLPPSCLSWPEIISKNNNYRLKNHAQAASDNLAIFTGIVESLKFISSDDTVIVGWSHPCRKTFVYESDNLYQQECLNNSMKIQTLEKTFIRSKGYYGGPNNPNNVSFWKTMSPVNKNIPYYDDWYKKYFSITEQQINFTSYLFAVEKMLHRHQYLAFYFSKNSLDNVSYQYSNRDLFWLEFIEQHKSYRISDTDHHFNADGHQQWASLIQDKLHL